MSVTMLHRTSYFLVVCKVHGLIGALPTRTMPYEVNCPLCKRTFKANVRKKWNGNIQYLNNITLCHTYTQCASRLMEYFSTEQKEVRINENIRLC